MCSMTTCNCIYALQVFADDHSDYAGQSAALVLAGKLRVRNRHGNFGKGWLGHGPLDCWQELCA